jgi:general secretion pathway protein M
MNKLLANLDKRERLILAAGTVVLFLGLGYILLVAPFYSSMATYRREIPAKEQELAWMRKAALEVRQFSAVASQAGDNQDRLQSPLSAIDSSARELGLGRALKRVEPAGQNEVRIWMEEAPFDEVLRWLANLGSAYAIEVSEFVVETTRNGQGQVNARITLVRNQP